MITLNTEYPISDDDFYNVLNAPKQKRQLCDESY